MAVTIPPAVIMALADQCAPDVAPTTIAAIVRTESQGNELAINVNSPGRKVAQPTSVAQAVEVARVYVARGYSVDLGLGQINSRNMKVLGLTWATVFDPCSNLAAAGAVLAGNYHKISAGLHPQHALRIALSMYNTGSQSRGFTNGYVSKVVSNAGLTDGVQPAVMRLVALPADARKPGSATAQLAELVAENTPTDEPHQAAPPPKPPLWDVFATAAYARARARGED